MTADVAIRRLVVLPALLAALLLGPRGASAGEAPAPRERARVAAPSVERIAASAGPPFRVELAARVQLPPGTRLDGAVAFAGRTAQRTWTPIRVEEGRFTVTLESDLLARDGLYEVLIAFDPKRQPLERAGRFASFGPQRWSLPVYVGSPDQELSQREAERKRLSEMLEALTLLAEDVATAFGAGAERGASADRDRIRLEYDLQRVEAQLDGLRPTRLLVAHFPDAVADVQMLVSLAARTLARVQEDPTTAPARGVLSPEKLRAEVARRREIHVRAGLVDDGRVGEPDVRRTLGLALALARDERAFHAGIVGAGESAPDKAEVERAVRRFVLLARQLGARAEAIAAAPEPDAFAGSGVGPALVALAAAQERVTGAHAVELHQRVGLAPPEAPEAVLALAADAEALAAAVAERDGLVERLAGIAERRQDAIDRELGEALALLRKLRATWDGLVARKERDDGAVALWRAAVELQRDRFGAARSEPDDVLAQTGAARWGELFLGTLLQRADLAARPIVGPQLDDLDERREYLDGVLDRAERRIAELVGKVPSE